MKHFVFTSAHLTSDKIPKSWEFFSRQIWMLVYIMMWWGRRGKTAWGEDTDLIMIHYELLQETCDRGHLNYLPTLHFTDSTVAQSQPREETFIIIFTNLFHQLSKPSYGRDIEIINLYLNRAPTYRPSYWLSPRVLTHSKLPASLFVSLWHLKTPRRLGVVSPVQYWACCVHNLNVFLMTKYFSQLYKHQYYQFAF